MANRVDHLLVRPFAHHTFEEQMNIKRMGPHQPIDIVITQHKANSDKKHANRSFVVRWFSKVKWLTASESRKGLFCFPCLLFGDDSTWSRAGFYDLKHLSERIRRHECGSSHSNNCLRLKLFGLDGDPDGTSSSSSARPEDFKGAELTALAAAAASGCGVATADFMAAMMSPSTASGTAISSSSQAATAVAICGSAELEERHKGHVMRHNAEVDRKHGVLTRLIDCMLFCFSTGLPLKVSSLVADMAMATAESSSDGRIRLPLNGTRPPYIFSELLQFSATVNDHLARNLRGAKSFLTDTIYNELLDAMLHVYREELAMEVSGTRYVSILMEDLTQMLGQGRTAVVLRYLTSGGQLVERLWGLLDAPVDEIDFADVMARHFSRFCFDTKLVSHSHNGLFTSMASGGPVTIGERIMKVFPYATYVQSYVHPLTVTLCHVCSIIEPIRVFFANLAGFASFFSSSPRRASMLRDISDGLVFGGFGDERLVATVFENRKSLLACFDAILEGDNWDSESIHGAYVLQDLLNSTRFSFFLKFFHLVMPFADILHRKFMMTDLTEASAHNAVKNFTTAIEWIAFNEIDNISATPTVVDSHSLLYSKTMKMDVDEDWRQAAREACNVMTADVVERFRYVSHQLAFQLLDCDLYDGSTAQFPEEQLRAAAEAFPKTICSRKLKSELLALYGNATFKEPMSLISTLDVINKNDLRDDFSETCKLLEIGLTMPVGTAESERCFDTLPRTMACLRLNPEDQEDMTVASISSERLNAATVLAVQSDLIRSIPNFAENVIDRFAVQEHRRDAFVHKMFSPLPHYGKPRTTHLDNNAAHQA